MKPQKPLQKVTGRTGLSSQSFGGLSGPAAALLTAGSVLPDWIQMWRKDERRLKTERREGKRNIFLRSYWCNLKKQLQVDLKREPRIDCWQPKSDDFGMLEGNCWVMLKCFQDFLNNPSSGSTIFPKHKGQNPGWKTAARIDVRFPKAYTVCFHKIVSSTTRQHVYTVGAIRDHLDFCYFSWILDWFQIQIKL